ncbi:SDR family NAD(P)-dependent oxidoreductase [Alsobacter sp. KACC 23698]|uniref:SDR family NAD(P)-dependent oxidoreductase n=1 Tax=Alsobacter sp. KACC 23698 TaxID=3149229 RepID=A0AAU7J9Z1_9HYPH
MSDAKTLAIVGYGPGIGAAVARRFAQAGYRVLGLSRRADGPAGAVELRQADASDPSSLSAALSGERVDALVFNAYRMTPAAGPSDLTPEDLMADMQVNLAGALASVRAVLPGMRTRGTGAILFTGGGLAFDPTGWLAAASLAAGKAALRNFAQALNAELAPQGIHAGTVTVAGMVQPGTPFDPDHIADAFWDLAQDQPGHFRADIVFKGKGV